MERELADKKELSTVYFEGNPLQTRSPALYRNKVHLALPQIQQIDASMLNIIHPACVSGYQLTSVQPMYEYLDEFQAIYSTSDEAVVRFGSCGLLSPNEGSS